MKNYIDAASIVIDNHPNVQFLMVGDVTSPELELITYKNELLERVNKLGLQENFCFTGLRKDVIDIYALADVFCVSSCN